MSKVRLINADVLAGLAMLPDESVQCCVTSPPYWGLRDYGVKGQIGLEPTIEEYVNKMVEVFREVRRVLRSSGCLFLNLGDSYYGGGGAHQDHHANPGISKSAERNGVPKSRGERGPGKALTTHNGPNRQYQDGLKPKDLCGIPWRVALALQADGWWWRQWIPWVKENSMPESAGDRPNNSLEVFHLFTKSANYYFDMEGAKECVGIKRNWRNGDHLLILDQPTESYPQAHFATFGQKVIEPFIRAGSSERGCCPTCGAPWRRVVEKTGHINKREAAHQPNNTPTKTDSTGWAPITRATDQWTPTCTCNAGEPIPCTVLDPFSGAGTTALVAAKLGRDAIGIELSEPYVLMSEKRIRSELGMLATVEVIRDLK